MQPEEVKQVVRQTLLELGINVSDSDHVTEMQEDFAYLRRARKGSNEVGKWAKRGLIGTGISAAAFVGWEGLKAMLRIKTGQ